MSWEIYFQASDGKDFGLYYFVWLKLQDLFSLQCKKTGSDWKLFAFVYWHLLTFWSSELVQVTEIYREKENTKEYFSLLLWGGSSQLIWLFSAFYGLFILLYNIIYIVLIVFDNSNQRVSLLRFLDWELLSMLFSHHLCLWLSIQIFSS